MADRPKTSRISTGSRVSFAEQPSPASMRFDDMSSRREDELEHSLQQRGGAESFISASGIDAATARAIRRLDDLTRQSFFSEDGHLQYDDEDEEDEEEDAAILEARRRKSFGRSMSEPLEGEADGSVLFLGGDDSLPQVQSDEEDQVSDSLAVDAADDDSDGLARRLAADDSVSRDLSDRRDASITGGDGDDSRVSRVSFAEQEEVSFQVDDAYSSDDGAVEYGLSIPEIDDEEDSDADQRDASSAGQLDLMDPKDLNALLKRRIVKKRKSRISPHTGEPVPPLPASVMRDIFSSFLTPSSSSTSSSLLSSGGGSTAKKAKLDSTVLDELDSACHDFFADFAANLLTQAKTRSSRRAADGMNITEQDVVAVLKRQGRVTQRHDASSLAHKLLPRELTDQMELSRWAKAGTVQTTLSGMFAAAGARKGQVEEGEGSSSEDVSSG